MPKGVDENRYINQIVKMMVSHGWMDGPVGGDGSHGTLLRTNEVRDAIGGGDAVYREPARSGCQGSAATPKTTATTAPESTSPIELTQRKYDELQRDVEVGLFQQRDHGLKVVALLRADAHLVTLDLRLDALRTLVADQLGDLLGVLAGDALLDGCR